MNAPPPADAKPAPIPSARYSVKQKLLATAERVVYRAAGLPSALRALRAVPTPTTPAAAIHRHYATHYWRLEHRKELADIALAALIWPIAVPLSAALYTRRNGRVIQSRTGKSPRRQFAEQLRLAITAGILPPWYYVFEFHDDARRANAAAYLHRFETKLGIYDRLGRHVTSPLSNKYEFARHCAGHGVRAVQPILLAHRGVLTTADGTPPTLPALPPQDLFLKPQRGRGGKGAERWDHTAAGYRHGNQTLGPEAFLDHLRAKSSAGNWLVQPRLINHPSLTDLANGALATVRVLTCLNERGEPEATQAVFRMAIGNNHTVDNIHAGGIAAAVNLHTGQLTAATNIGMDARLGWLDRHPTSGALITGRVLPLWDELLALARQAHAAFNDRLIIGWDIACLADGPQIIEGNGGPCLDLIQRPHQAPIGNGRFGVLLAHHLAQYEAQR